MVCLMNSPGRLRLNLCVVVYMLFTYFGCTFSVFFALPYLLILVSQYLNFEMYSKYLVCGQYVLVSKHGDLIMKLLLASLIASTGCCFLRVKSRLFLVFPSRFS